MDGPVLPQPKQTSILNNGTFIALVSLIIGLILGFTIKSLTTPQKSPVISQKPSFDESKLPVSLSLLNNPIVYEWRGSVRGKLTQKDEHTFTLVDDKGNSIIITDVTTAGTIFKTMFFDKNNKNKESSLSAIPVGSTLLGDFWIFKNGPNTPVGSMFTKQ